MKSGKVCLLGSLFMLGSAVPAFAGPPLTNVEGVGGVALNPMAYVANPICEGEKGFCDSTLAAKPQLGYWHIDLSDTDITWDAIGTNMSFYNRVEIGFGVEFINLQNTPDGIGSGTKKNLSAKVNLLKENEFGLPFLPAISAGVIRKSTDTDLSSVAGGATEDSGWDYYGVATKTIPVPVVPVVLNAGILSTKGLVRGVLGFGPERDEAFFANIELIPLPNMIVGWEYEQNVKVGKNDGLPTPTLWEAHVAWMHKDLTLVGSYIYTQDEEDSGGFGDGWVASAQYAF